MLEKRQRALDKKLAPRDSLIVQKRLMGKSANAIVKELKEETGDVLSKQGVYYVLKKEEISKMLEREYCKIASSVPRVTDNIINAATSFSKDQQRDDKQISWEANKLIAQAHGIIPTANQSVVHQTYIQHQTNNIVPQVIADLAAKYFGEAINVPSRIIDCVEEHKETEDDESTKRL